MFRKATDWVKKLFKSSFFIFGLLNPAGLLQGRKILITRPDHDITTLYLFQWTELVIKLIKEDNSFLLVDLPKEQANKKEFISQLKKGNPVLVLLNGHGSGTTVCGYNNEALVTLGNDEKYFRNKIIYAISCRSARTLGKYLIGQGTKTYLGYDDDFIFIIEEPESGNLLEDKTAGLYLEPAILVALSMIKGNTVGDAFRESQNKFKENIDQLLNSEASEKTKELLPYLYWDMEHQVCLGDSQAKCEFLSEKEYKKQKKLKLLIVILVLLLIIAVIVKCRVISGGGV